MTAGSILLLALGLGLALSAGYALTASTLRSHRGRLLMVAGHRAVGRVLATGSDPGELITYWVNIQYTHEGEPVTAKVVVSQRDQRRFWAGQRVGLTYAPSRPEVVRLDRPEWDLR